MMGLLCLPSLADRKSESIRNLCVRTKKWSYEYPELEQRDGRSGEMGWYSRKWPRMVAIESGSRIRQFMTFEDTISG